MTKGKWEVYISPSNSYHIKSGRYLIADLKKGEAEVNAYKIAAAPAMYEALKGLLRDYSTNPTSDIFFRACENARDALAQAEGGNND